MVFGVWQCAYVCLRVRHTLFTPLKPFFAPISRRPISKNFLKIKKHLGENNEKKRSQIWTLLLGNVIKLPHNFFFFIISLLDLALIREQNMWCTGKSKVHSAKASCSPTSWSPISKLFRDLESLGISFGTKWSQIWTFLFSNGLKLPHKKTLLKGTS